MNTADSLVQAEDALNDGDLHRARRLLKSLIDVGHPDALYLSAHFGDRELTTEFEARRVRILQALVQQGHPRACYAMARHYEIGDLVQQDGEASAALDRKAAEAGHGAATLAHGLNCYYGSNGIARDREVGVRLIEAAIQGGVEGAEEKMRDIQRLESSTQDDRS